MRRYYATSRMKLHRLVWLVASLGCAHPRPVVIDRFSERAGHLMTRAARADLPKPDQPIDFDRAPFITQGLGPTGAPVRYYNFDVQSDVPGTLYRFTHAGAHAAIAGQLDVVDAIPGEPGYSDFWRLVWVEVPAAFVPGSITSAAQLHGLPTVDTGTAIDCPIVPRGSTAREGHGVPRAEPIELWVRGARVTCLRFAGELAVVRGRVPTSPIYVTFGSEPAFRTEAGSPQTHNVVLSLPGDLDYSPLWAVHIYDAAAFDRVHDETSATAAPLVKHGPLVNCPIVSIGP
jgi:hypothetical protein